MNFNYDSSDSTILPKDCYEGSTDSMVLPILQFYLNCTVKNHKYTSFFHPLQKIVESEES